ncbi:MAG: nuclear transport factor 2 family protein [Bacteroidia bacterium]|nr:nuclear transport factor 2 family protein [Bacteroidia bacterium]
MKYSIFIFLIVLGSCSNSLQNNKLDDLEDTIHKLIDQWHRDAANADLNAYVGFMDSACIYVGTDATEKWSKDEFGEFCKPYFDKKKTWDFKSHDRTINISSDQNTAWFYEILQTHMGTCRGSGTLEYKNNQWKLQQYILSLAIPNEDMNEVKQVVRNKDSIFQSYYFKK